MGNFMDTHHKARVHTFLFISVKQIFTAGLYPDTEGVSWDARSGVSLDGP